MSAQSVNRIVSFSKSLPGFTTLTCHDQMTLLKASCLEIMILRVAQRYDVASSCIHMTNGARMTVDMMRDGGLGPTADSIFNFSRTLHMNVDDTQIALLTAICLLSADRSGLHEGERCEQYQDPILAYLRYYVARNKPNEAHRFAKLLMKLTDVRSISVKGAEKVLNVQKKSKLHKDRELVEEVLDREENFKEEKLRQLALRQSVMEVEEEEGEAAAASRMGMV